MGAVDDFNAIRALNLQFEMQKAGSMCGTGSSLSKKSRGSWAFSRRYGTIE